MPEPAKTHVRIVSHYYDNLGILVAYKIIDENIISNFMGENIIKTWTILELYIQYERKLRKSEFGYQEFFENLVVRVQKSY